MEGLTGRGRGTSSLSPRSGWLRSPRCSRCIPPLPYLSLYLLIFQVVLFLAKQALLLATGIPLPFPALLDGLMGDSAKLPYIDKVCEVLEKEVQDCASDQIKAAFSDVSAALESSSAHAVVNTAQSQQTSSPHRLDRLTSSSYEALRELLLSLEKVQNPSPDWRPRYTGMELVCSRMDNSFSWVSVEGKEEFMRRGRGALVGGGTPRK